MNLSGRTRYQWLPDDLMKPTGVGDDVARQRIGGLDPMTQSAVSQYAAMPAQQAPQGRDWAGGLSDIGTSLMAAQAAINGDYGASSRLSSSIGAAERERKAAMLARVRELEDYKSKKQIDQQFAPPVRNDTVEDYRFRVQTLGQEAADDWLRRSGDPIVNTTLPNGQFYSGPQSGLPTALGGGASSAAAPSERAIEALKSNPNMRGDFDSKYGAGASARYLGGAGGNASGGFQW